MAQAGEAHRGLQWHRQARHTERMQAELESEGQRGVGERRPKGDGAQDNWGRVGKNVQCFIECVGAQAWSHALLQACAGRGVAARAGVVGADSHPLKVGCMGVPLPEFLSLLSCPIPVDSSTSWFAHSWEARG